MTIREYASKWLVRRRAEVRPRSYQRYKNALDAFLEAFGERELEGVTLLDLRDWQAVRAGGNGSGRRPAMPATLRMELARIKAMFRDAAAEGVVWRNPVEELRLPRKRKKPRPLDVEYDDIRDAIILWLVGNYRPYDAICMLILNTGLRVGELWALRWKDVDERGIHICPHGSWEPKTDSRDIPLSSDATAALKILAEFTPPRGEYVANLTYIQGANTGKRLNVGDFEKRVLRKLHWVCRKERLPEIRIHDLRGLFATRLFACGGSAPVVQRAMGHKNLSTTQLYARVPDGDMERAFSRFH